MIKKGVISIFLVLYFFSSQAQSIQNENISDVESLFSERNYSKVIEILSLKRKTDSLNMREYYLITKSYGRTRQYSNGYVLSTLMRDKSLRKKDTTNILAAYNLMTENLVDLSEMNKAIEACNEAKPYFREQDSVSLQKLYFKLGVAYYHTGEYQKAYETYSKITRKEYRKLSLFTNNYALTLMGLNREKEALPYLKKTIQIRKESGNLNQINTAYSNIALIYMNNKKWNLAKKYLDSAFMHINDKSQLTDRKNLYEKYFKLYINQNKLDEASVYLENINNVNDKLFDKRMNEKLTEITNSFERETNLKKEVKIIDNQLIESEKQKLRIVIIALASVLAFITSLFYFKYKSIASAHQNIVTEQKLLRSQMTPHFIFNSLSVLQGMILNKEDKKAVRYLSKFSKLLRLILENSREKLVLLEDELTALKNYIDLQSMQAVNSFTYNLVIDESLENQEIYVPPMLIQPFVENSIEHGFKSSIKNPEIEIKLLLKNEQLNCEIIDNGVGINSLSDKNNSLKNKKSLATKITSERLEIFSREYNSNANLTIEDRKIDNEQGTRVTLTLPYKTNKDA